MALLTDRLPRLGAPDRRTELTYAAYPAGGSHTWLSGARLARVIVIGAGGAGGLTGKYLQSSTYYYNAGGGGNSGAVAMGYLQLRPSGEVAVPFIIGAGAANANGGASYFGDFLWAEGGTKGNPGSSSSTNGPGAAMTLQSGLITSTIYSTGSITQPRAPYLLPVGLGAAGVNGAGSAGGSGGSNPYSQWGPPVTNPASGAPLAGSTPYTERGGGASGGTWAPPQTTDHSVTGTSARGAHGCIIVEEWL